jgi:hypothetical protein
VIAAAFITHWRAVVPWAADHQFEDDLILSRALVEISSDPAANLVTYHPDELVNSRPLPNPPGRPGGPETAAPG